MTKRNEDFRPNDRIRRAKHESNYTPILNATIRDERLSWKARGLHHYILSLPDTWEINIAHLSKQSDRDGADVVKSALKELESCGYISKEQVRDSGGKFNRTQWNVYEEPQVNSPQADSPQADSPQAGKPPAVKPSTVKPPLRINNIEIIQVENNYEENTNTPLTPQGELVREEIPFTDWEEEENPEPENQENLDRIPELLVSAEIFQEPLSLAKSSGVEKSSAAAKKSSSPSKTDIAQCFEVFQHKYNELFGDIWAECDKPNPDRLRRFAATWKESKEALFEDLEYASRYLHQEEWALKKRYSIDTVLWSGRLTKYAEMGKKIPAFSTQPKSTKDLSEAELYTELRAKYAADKAAKLTQSVGAA